MISRWLSFEKISDDLIQWQEVSPGKWSPVNISKARVRGFETEGKLHLALMDLGVNYTFTDPEDRDIGQQDTIRHTTPGKRFSLGISDERYDSCT